MSRPHIAAKTLTRTRAEPAGIEIVLGDASELAFDLCCAVDNAFPIRLALFPASQN